MRRAGAAGKSPASPRGEAGGHAPPGEGLRTNLSPPTFLPRKSCFLSLFPKSPKIFRSAGAERNSAIIVTDIHESQSWARSAPAGRVERSSAANFGSNLLRHGKPPPCADSTCGARIGVGGERPRRIATQAWLSFVRLCHYAEPLARPDLDNLSAHHLASDSGRKVDLGKLAEP